MTALVTLEGVGKRFPNGTIAISGLDLSVRHDEFVAVVGTSGCGKSTVLRLVSGLEKPTSGRLSVETRSLGYVFQDPTLLPWRTVERNVALSAELRRVPAAERRRRVSDAIAMVGLSDFTRFLPHTLSGGMRMRVSLARCLVSEPRLVLLDEPFGALDEFTRLRLDEHLHDLFLANRFGALFVTHSVMEAVYLASRVIVLSTRPGRVIGEVKVALEYPRVPEVRYTQEFTSMSAEVSALLRQGNTA